VATEKAALRKAWQVKKTTEKCSSEKDLASKKKLF